MMRRPTAIALLCVIAWLLLAVAASLFPIESDRIALDRILCRSSAEAWLGCDDLGRDIGLRIIAGAKVSFAIAGLVVLTTTFIGLTIGVVAAWYGGWVDLLAVRVIDTVLAFPGILLAIALAGVLGPGLPNVIIALAVVGWAGIARLTRSLTQSVRARDHIEVAEALGTPAFRIVRWHVLPLIAGPLIVEVSFAFAAIIVAEAGLSFLGLGVQPPTPSWGGMIRDGTRYLLLAPHVVIVPSLALASLVISINLLGDRMRDRIGQIRS